MDKSDFEERVSAVVKYLLEVLLYNNTELCDKVYYVKEDVAEKLINCCSKQICIIRSDFFEYEKYGTFENLPQEPLNVFRGVKFLYGQGIIKKKNNNIVLYADLIASSFFFLSRYEEFVYKERNYPFERFPYCNSILFRERLIATPIVDEYGRLLCDLLNEIGYDTRIYKGFDRVYFTHDIDRPYYKNTLFHAVKQMGKSLIKDHRFSFYPITNLLGITDINPMNTWDYMLKKEQTLCERYSDRIICICFILANEKDDPYSIAYISEEKGKDIVRKMKRSGAAIGLHTSYNGAADKGLLSAEKARLEMTIRESVKYNRNHYLRQIQVVDMLRYYELGFTDDYTIGFAEQAGFKLGTSHKVKWVNPEDLIIYDIWLHGLNIMDSSFGNEMQVDFKEAKLVCKRIIDMAYSFNGEIDILWHNGAFGRSNYSKELYDYIVQYISDLINKDEHDENNCVLSPAISQNARK